MRSASRSCAPKWRGRNSSRGGPVRSNHARLAIADRLVNDAAADGIGVVAMVESTPCWASSAPASLLRSCAPGRSGQASAWPPSDPSTYAAFVAYLAQRYGTKLAAIEVWNEPDQANEDYFAGPEKPQRYAAILRAAYPAIKQVNPQIPVLAGSLVGSNGVFLRALYAAGIKGYYDGLSVHFYNLVLGSLRAIHETQLANGDNKPLWLNEFGWTSCWPKHRTQQEQACVTPATQASNLTDIFRSLARTPYVASEVVYGLQDSSSENFGVLNTAGGRKPSFAALAGVMASPFGSPRPVTLRLRRRGRPRGGERLGARRRLHGAGSIPGRHSALPGPVHARPLQPATRSRCRRRSARAACRCASTSTGRASARPCASASEQSLGSE